MSLKSFIARKWAAYIRKQIDRWAADPIATQEKVFRSIIQKAKHTAFGRDHHFEEIHSYEDFVRQVPIRDYEALAPYIERVKKGEENILWPGKPLYFAKTSGTTSGAKYIPLTKDSMPYHIEAARNAIMCYIAETGKADFVSGKMIFLQGSYLGKEKRYPPR